LAVPHTYIIRFVSKHLLSTDSDAGLNPASSKHFLQTTTDMAMLLANVLEVLTHVHTCVIPSYKLRTGVL
jgi:hypothetical protein